MSFVDNILIKHADNVKKFGVSIQFVGPESDGSMPPYAYTIGMAKHGYPDLYIAGAIDPSTQSFILNNLYALWCEKGYSVGEIGGLLGNGVGLMLLPIMDSSKLVVGVNRAYYSAHPEHLNAKSDLPQFVQVLWPDTAGKYPTDEGYNDQFVQPVFASMPN